jgi:glycosyltransferase involved in cell wall biosynthesis
MNSDKRSQFSFVVPVLNGERYISRCLEHIVAEMSPEDELIVVDNGSTDHTVSIVKEFSQVHLLECPKLTISALRNRGAATATKGTLAFIDSDCLVCPGWRQAAVKVLSDPAVNVTGSVYDLPESPSWVEEAFCSVRKATPADTHVLFGGNLVVNRHVFISIDGFNEKLITDEDSDICLRLRAKGQRIWEDPNVRVIHLGNAKTLKQFYRKVKWQSTSILETTFSQKLDKPMAMTLLFMLACVFSLATLALSPFHQFHPVLVVAPPLVIPFVTILHRLFRGAKLRFFFQLWILYLFYYLARSATILERLFGKRSQNQWMTDKTRGK